jgi:hypothetical protein
MPGRDADVERRWRVPHRDVRYDALYLAFAHRPRPARVRGCPCCVGAAREASLLAAPLRELDAETLGFYAFKAMSTFGREEDFLYFFPRIAELFAGGETLGALCLDILARKIAELLREASMYLDVPPFR